jgi:hypothetical protein
MTPPRKTTEDEDLTAATDEQWADGEPEDIDDLTSEDEDLIDIDDAIEDDNDDESGDESADDEAPAEEAEEALDELEAEELEMLTEDEEAEALPVDEAAELRHMRREAIALDTSAETAREGEFVCSNCFLVKRTSTLANRRKLLCRDCA